jgi:hypothetical protein
MMGELQDQAIRQHCKTLRMPTIGGQLLVGEAGTALYLMPTRETRWAWCAATIRMVWSGDQDG